MYSTLAEVVKVFKAAPSALLGVSASSVVGVLVYFMTGIRNPSVRDGTVRDVLIMPRRRWWSRAPGVIWRAVRARQSKAYWTCFSWIGRDGERVVREADS